jgi:hypothetical protein
MANQKRQRLYVRQSYAMHQVHCDYLIRLAFKRKISMSETLRGIVDAHMKLNPLRKKPNAQNAS